MGHLSESPLQRKRLVSCIKSSLGALIFHWGWGAGELVGCPFCCLYNISLLLFLGFRGVWSQSTGPVLRGLRGRGLYLSRAGGRDGELEDFLQSKSLLRAKPHLLKTPPPPPVLPAGKPVFKQLVKRGRQRRGSIFLPHSVTLGIASVSSLYPRDTIPVSLGSPESAIYLTPSPPLSWALSFSCNVFPSSHSLERG